jgi:putative peptide zinc metalloprotease protein
MSLHSPRWHRVAALRPRLPAQLRVRRQQLRGQTWILLAEAGGTRSVRLNAAAWELAGRFDGTRSVQQLWERTLQHGDEAITQDELIDLLAQLREAALLRFEHGADFDALLPHLDRVQRTRRRGNLLVWRVPLADPSAWLDRLGALPRRAAKSLLPGR